MSIEANAYTATELMIALLSREVTGLGHVVVGALSPLPAAAALLAQASGATGATILGSGQVVPILNVLDLLTSALHTQRGRLAAPAALGSALPWPWQALPIRSWSSALSPSRPRSAGRAAASLHRPSVPVSCR